MSSHVAITPMSHTSMSSSLSRTSLPSVKIGEGSFSPGDVIIESLLPRVRPKNQSTASSHSSKSKDLMSSSTSFDGAGDSSNDSGIDVLPLRDHPSVRRAQDECATLLNGNSVAVVEDEDVKEDVVEITGRDAELVFPCRNIFQYVVLFVKDMEQFLEIHIDVLDDKQQYQHLRLTNARSLAKVEANDCQLPMVMGQEPGWRYVCVDLHDLTRRAFGTKHVTTVQLRITGQCRVLRVFFQDEWYSDNDLPPYLSFLG